MLPEENDQIQAQFNNKIIERIDFLVKKISEIEDRLFKIEGVSRSDSKISAELKNEPPNPAPYEALDKHLPAINKDHAAAEKGSLESEIGLKWLGRIGVVALIFGVAFFLKYAFDNNWIGEVGRIILGVVSGSVMIGLGEYLRKKYAIYSQILTGGGIAIFYLSVYAAFGFYRLIDQVTAFAFMGIVTAFAGFLAVRYEGLSLAGLGIIGGFLTPVLLSSGVNNEAGLFTYIIILDLGILGISFFRNWRHLNLIGFLGTGFIFLSWSMRFYTNEQLFLTEFFLTIFFLIFAIATIAHNLLSRQKSDNKDSALIALNALAYFGASYSLLNPDYHSFMGFFAAIMSLIYLGLAAISYLYNPDDKHLSLFLPGLSVLFLTLAISIQLEGNWITVGWAAEALILFWLGFSLQNYSLRIFGWIIFAVSIYRLICFDSQIVDLKSYWIILNKRFLTYAVVILSGVGSYALYIFFGQAIRPDEHRAKGILLLISNLLFLGILSSELITYYNQQTADLYYPGVSQCDTYSGSGGFGAQESVFCQDQRRQSEIAINDNAVKIKNIENSKNVALSFLWALYAIIVSIVGIFVKNKLARLFGIALFGLTIIKLFIFDLWGLGALYRIISSASLGVILLIVSFVYNKYKDRIGEII